MKTSTITIAPYHPRIKRKNHRRAEKVRNSVGLHPVSEPVSFIYFLEGKINNKILFYVLVKHEHQQSEHFGLFCY